MKFLVSIFIFIFSPYLMAFNGDLYLCDSTHWVEVKEDTTNKKENTTFSFYIDTDMKKLEYLIESATERAENYKNVFFRFVNGF